MCPSVSEPEEAATVIGPGAPSPSSPDELARLRARIIELEAERADARAAADQAERNFRHFVESKSELMLVTDEDGRLLYANPAAVAALGPETTAIGRCVHDSLPAEDAERLAGDRRRDARLDVRTVLSRAGRAFPLSLRAWWGEWSGRPCRFLVARDRSAEAAALDRFERIFRRNPCPMALTRAGDGVLLDVNQAWTAFAGIGADQAIGRTADALGLVPEADDRSALRRRLQEHAPVLDRPLRLRLPSGDERRSRVSFERLDGPDGLEILSVLQDVTAAERTMDALEDRELLFRSLFADSPVAIVLIDPDTDALVEANRAALDTWDAADLETLARHWTRRGGLHGAGAGEPLYHAVVDQGPQRFLWKTERLDGASIELHAHLAATRLGGSPRLIATLVDVTAEQRARALASEHERRLRLALASARQGIYDVDLRTSEVVLTPEYASMLGYRPETFVESFEAVQERLHPEDHPAAVAALRDHLEGRAAEYRVEFRLRTASGGWKWILSLGSVVERDADGRPLRIVGTHTDIDARKRAEQRVVESEAQLALALAATNDVVWDWDLERDRETWGPAAARVLGWSPSDEGVLPATWWREHLHPEDRPRVEASMDAALRARSGTHWEAEYRLRHADGHYLVVHDRANLVRDADGRVRRAVGAMQDVTEQRGAERALAALNEALESRVAARTAELARQAAALDASQEAIAIYDGADCHYANPAFRRRFGTSAPPWSRLFEPSLVERLGEGPGTTGRREARVLDADGHYFDAEVELSRLEDGGVVMVVLDVSARKRAEAELAAREARYRTILEGAADAIVIVDATGRILEVNPGAERLFGRSLQSLVGDSVHSLHPPEAAEEIAGLFARVQSGAPLDVPALGCRRADGQTVYADLSARRLEDLDPPLLLGIFHDVTARRAVERRLRELSEQLGLSLEAGRIGCWSFEPASGVLRWDDRMHALYDQPAGGAPPTPADWAARLASDESRAALERLLSGEALGSNPVELLLELTPAAGGPRVVRNMAIAVPSEAGLARRIIGVHIDVTELVTRERTLEALNRQLADATRQKDDFLANMSHELRTPLNAVLGLSEALQMRVYGELQPAQTTAVRRIQDSGRHLLELINDVLDLSKIEAGKIDLALESTLVEPLARSILATLEPGARGRGLELDIELDPTAREVLADTRRLRQILLNLLGNALKFTGRGGHVTLRTRREPTRVVFEVRDDGEGIPLERQPLLFQPFTQLESTRQRRHGGTGLGLSIVKKLVTLHGGEVWLDSAPGRGSTFAFSLSVPGSTAPASRRRESSAEIDALVLPTARARILYAEDDEANVPVIRDFLDSRGYAVTIARDGVEAVALARELAPDLILMDVQMPDMDGLEATRRIRAAERGRRVPIVALTAFAMPGDRERCLAAGMDEHLAKPVSLRALAQTITAWLREREAP